MKKKAISCSTQMVRMGQVVRVGQVQQRGAALLLSAQHLIIQPLQPSQEI